MAQFDLFLPPKRPWNTARIIGPKPPFKPKHIWGIRQQLKANGRVRDLAMFNCAIDAKLRGCDLVKLRVSDVAPGGLIRARATIIQQKTGQPVPFEITEPTRDALAAWIKVRGRRYDDWLFPSRSRSGQHVSTRQYARLGRDDRTRAAGVRDAQPQTNQGRHDLQEDGQPAGLPASSRASEAGEYRSIPRHRGRRRP